MHKEKSRLSNDQALVKQRQETIFTDPRPNRPEDRRTDDDKAQQDAGLMHNLPLMEDIILKTLADQEQDVTELPVKE